MWSFDSDFGFDMNRSKHTGSLAKSKIIYFSAIWLVNENYKPTYYRFSTIRCRVYKSLSTSIHAQRKLRICGMLSGLAYGRGYAFLNSDDFVNKIETRGLVAMKLIAKDTKPLGVWHFIPISE